MSEPQRHIAICSMATPVCYFLLRIMHGTSGIKFPTTGPNEILFFDSVLSGVLCFFCSRLTVVQNHCTVFCITITRLFILFTLGLSIYFVPVWYEFTGNYAETSLVWFLLGVIIIGSATCFFLVTAFFVAEELFLHYTWEAFKEYLCGKDFPVVAPPEYSEAIVSSSLPPSYEEAVAARPPGYTPTFTPPVPNSRPESHVVRINSTRSSVHFARVQTHSDEEEE